MNVNIKGNDEDRTRVVVISGKNGNVASAVRKIEDIIDGIKAYVPCRYFKKGKCEKANQC